MGGANSFTVNVTKQETFDRTKELLDEIPALVLDAALPHRHRRVPDGWHPEELGTHRTGCRTRRHRGTGRVTYTDSTAEEFRISDPDWQVPTLLLWAGADRLVNPAGSRAFASAAPKERVQAHCFEPLYHELFNESPELADPVFERLQHWLAAHG